MKMMIAPYTPFRPLDAPPAETPILPPPVVLVRDKLKWEYKRVVRSLAKTEGLTEDELNTLGAEGWELATTVTDSPNVYFYLKRTKR